MKLVADLGAGPEAEIELAQIEREDWAVPETLGLTLAEGKQITATIRTEMVRAQAATMGERFKYCAHCESALSSKGYRSVTFRPSSATCRFEFVGSSAANAVKSQRNPYVSRC
ncbi:hypothetical protein [Methylocystis bryophila]|uniref:hypothetical protein n=1 Tax=Methylocystis bryophila TaxID=655015 RepID=UPI001AEC8739|nr:hypothetical protein [Methylocystis bryophila]